MIQIHDHGKIIEVEPSDKSQLTRGIMRSSELLLSFRSDVALDIHVGATVDFEGETFTLIYPSELRKLRRGYYDYTVTMHSSAELLKQRLLKDPSDPGRTAFTFTGSAHDFSTLVARSMGEGWSVGDCMVSDGDRMIAFREETCLGALARIAEDFHSEWVVERQTIAIRKQELWRDAPVAMSYGRGKGFLSGVSRSGDGDKLPISRLYVVGGSRNIDPAAYGSRSLHLPDGSTSLSSGVEGREAALDLSHIYPSRVGTVSEVVTVSEEKCFYDIKDASIPAELNFSDCRIPGEKAVIRFQSGALAGRELEIRQSETALEGYHHEERRFELVPREEDGFTFPSARWMPKAGDRYAVFGISLPPTYIKEAEERMLSEAKRYIEDNKEPVYTFRGEVDGIWARAHWLEVGGKLVPGGHVLFSDPEFHPSGSVIRIVSTTQAVNDPHAPSITLSTAPVPGSLLSRLDRVEADEVVRREQIREVQRQQSQSYRQALEHLSMVDRAVEGLEGFTRRLKPSVLETMGILVGSQATQLDFVRAVGSLESVTPAINYDPDDKALHVGESVLRHQTIGITTVKDRRDPSEYRYWRLPEYVSPPLTDPDRSYYIYARAARVGTEGSFLLSEEPIPMESEEGWYHLLIGTLSSIDGGDRAYNRLYGFSMISPGQMVVDTISSANGRMTIDLARGEIYASSVSFSRPDGARGSLADLAGEVDELQSHPPKIVDGKWHVWDGKAQTYVNTGDDARGETGKNGLSPKILDGKWSVWDGSRWVSTGVPARGPKGEQGAKGEKGDPGKDVDTKVLNDLKTAVDDARRKLEDTVTKSELDGVVSAQEEHDIQAAKAALDAAKKAYDDAVKRAKELDIDYVEQVIDARSLDPNKYYAVCFTFPGVQMPYVFEIYRGLYQWGKDADWQLHEGGFSCHVRWSEKAGQWGSQQFDRTVDKVGFSFSKGGCPVSQPDQMGAYSVPYIYVRGGGIYEARTYCRTEEEKEKASNIYLLTETKSWNDGYDYCKVISPVSEITQPQTDISAAMQSTDNLKGYVDGAFRDGVVDGAEAKAIKTYINEVDAQWQSALGAYEKVYTNALLAGAPKTALLDCKTTLAGKCDDLTKYIATAISDGRATPAEVDGVNTRYNAYKGALRDFQKALKTAEEAIRDAGKTTGGRNLLRSERIIKSIAFPFRLYYDEISPREDAHTYTLSFDYWLAVDDPATDRRVCVSDGLIYDKDVIADAQWHHKVYTFDLPTEREKYPIKSNWLADYSSSNGRTQDQVKVRNVKLERGTVATDWTPATEDVQAEIDAINANPPRISAGDTWEVYDPKAGKYIDTGRTSKGDNGKAPIIKDGNWWEWDAKAGKYTDTGVRAIGVTGAKGAKGDKGDKGDGLDIIDTRNDNQPPSWYREKYALTTVREFKRLSPIEIPSKWWSGYYCTLETTVRWADTSGGRVEQSTTLDNGVQLRRVGTADDTTWEPWINVSAEVAAVRQGLANTDTLVSALEKAQSKLDQGVLTKADTKDIQYLLDSLKNGDTKVAGGLVLSNDIILSDPNSKDVTATISGTQTQGANVMRLGISYTCDEDKKAPVERAGAKWGVNLYSILTGLESDSDRIRKLDELGFTIVGGRSLAWSKWEICKAADAKDGGEATALSNEGTGHIGGLYFDGNSIRFGDKDSSYMQIGGTARSEYDMVNASTVIRKFGISGGTVRKSGTFVLDRFDSRYSNREIKYTANLSAWAEARAYRVPDNGGWDPNDHRYHKPEYEEFVRTESSATVQLRLELSRGGSVIRTVTSPQVSVSVSAQGGQFGINEEIPQGALYAEDRKSQDVTITISPSDVREQDTVTLSLVTTIRRSCYHHQGNNEIDRYASATASAGSIVNFLPYDTSQPMVSVTKDRAAFFYGRSKYVLLNYLESYVMKVVGNMLLQGNLILKGDLTTDSIICKSGGLYSGGVINEYGTVTRWVGRKITVWKVSTGRYKLSHNLGHINYVVQAIPVHSSDNNCFVIDGTETAHTVEVGVQWNSSWTNRAIHFVIYAQQ